ncbi:MAG: DNA repair ATPase, partial [Stackebrandtia sp.]
EGFIRDFAELYRYYRDTRLLQLRRMEGRLLAVFQVSERSEDLKVLRWQTDPAGAATYLDNQGDRDHVFPGQHDFEWTATTRDDHVNGRNPHVSVLDEIFVECVGGDLTVKIENNTDTGQGVYAEPVTDVNQSLADASISYARIGPLILLNVLPYNEANRRYLVFNTRTKAVARLDGIGQACRSLPEDQGLIFPDGYYLSTGVFKTFDTDASELEFEREIRSPNGEDVLYVFHARAEGRTLLLPYNLIRKSVANPILCHGYSLFDNGTMVAFRATSDEPARVHPMQVWQTPFVSDTFAAAQPIGTGPLERLGNAELVRGISDALSVARMVSEMAPATEVFEALIAACTRTFDAYHWLGDPDLGGLAEPLEHVRTTATQVLDEYATVAELTSQAGKAVAGAERDITAMVRRSRGEAPKSADAWVAQLAQLRQAQGHLVTLRDMRYVDESRLDSLTATVSEELTSAARRAVAFLRRDDAFDGYREDIARLTTAAEAIDTVANAEPLRADLAEKSAGLENLTEVVSDLDIADATVRTFILERIAEVLAAVNRARATLAARRRELMEGEGRAEFAAEFALFGQAVTAGLAAADTPSACDDQLGRLMLQLENLESRFSDFDDFLAELGDKRSEVYEAFSSRKQTLLDDQARRAQRLASSAERILGNVARRAGALESLDEINTYFAADAMVSKLRDIVAKLRELGETVRAEELDGRVKAARQEAARALRDRQDLFDGDTVKLGRHRLPVNTQPLDLTLVPDGDGLAFSLTGTDFRQHVDDPDFAATRGYWEQSLVSETSDVYRAEHLACAIMDEHEIRELHQVALSMDDLLAHVRRVAENRYDEGYERGVHDHDAAAILAAALRLESAAGLLRFPPSERAAAALYWAFGPSEPDRAAASARAASLARARATYGERSDSATGHGPAAAIAQWCAEVRDDCAAFLADSRLALEADTALVARYLFEELAGGAGFITSAAARGLATGFRTSLGRDGLSSYESDLKALDADLAARFQVVNAWLSGYGSSKENFDTYDLPEAVAIELCGNRLPRRDSAAEINANVDGLLGTHPRITGRKLAFRLDELLARTAAFRRDRVPGYRDYQRQRTRLIEAERRRLRVDEFRPKVMSAFVRNRLLDEVYLPLIGANLAKQLGAAGDDKRTDQSGMLL